MKPRLFLPIVLAIFLISNIAVLSAYAHHDLSENTSPGALLKYQDSVLPLGRVLQDTDGNPEDTNIESHPFEQNAQADSDVKVLIKQIHVRGVTFFPQSRIAAIVSPYENKEMSFNELRELAQKLTDLYYQKGYVTSHVNIPPQKVQDGVIHLDVLEGKVGLVEIEEGRYFKKRAISSHVRLSTGDAFNIHKLEKNLRDLNTNPDLQVSAKLRPSQEQNLSDVLFNIQDKHPWHLTPSLSNTGRRLVGVYQFGIGAENNNFLGFGDRLHSNFLLGQNLQGISAGYEVPFGNRGTSVGVNYAWNHISLDDEFKALRVRGVASILSPYIRQSLVQEDNWNLSADLAFDFKQQDTDQSGSDLNRDQLRVLRPGMNLNIYDRYGATFMRHEAAWGLDLFGAGNINQDGVPHAGQNGSFFRYTGNLTRIQQMPWNTKAIIRLAGQLSPDSLNSLERYQLGGAYTVRGYREGTLLGDKALMASFEWRMPAFLIPKNWHLPHSKRSLRDSLQLVAFADYGVAALNTSAASSSSTEQVLGAGLGIRAQLCKSLVGRLDLGFPLLRQDGFGMAPRIHFGLEAPLF